MDPSTAIGAAASALSLSKKLVEMIDAAKKGKEDIRLSKLIVSLTASAFHICSDMTVELREIRRDLRNADINIDSTISELYDNLDWYNFVSRNRLKKFVSRINGLETDLAVLVDDVSSVLMCADKVSTMQGALAGSDALKAQLDKISHSNLTLDQIIVEMLKVAENLRSRLQGGEPAPGPAPSTPILPLPGPAPMAGV